MTKNSSHEVGPSSQNNLRYISLPRLSVFTGACSGNLGLLGKWDQPLRNDFATKKSSQKVGTSCQNILRYLSLLMLSGFTGARSGYLGSLGKRDQPLRNFFMTKKVLEVV